MTKFKLIRDVLGSPIPQHLDEGSGFYIANTNGTGDATGVDFSKKKLLRDVLGSVIPQYYDVVDGRFKPVTTEGSGGNNGGSNTSNAGVPLGPPIIYENISSPSVRITATHKIVLEDVPNE